LEHPLDREYAIDVSPEADAMLSYHAAFLANVSENAAERLIQSFEINVNSLKTWPERYTWLDSPDVPKHKYRKLPFEKHYMILYHLEGDIVYIDAVIDGRQQYARFLR
jgi:plasmid stabilization system protein ParE